MYHIFGPDKELDVPDGEDMFEALSTPDAARTDIVWRYALTKLMVHQCFHELVDALAVSSKDWSHVVVNIVNPGWCGTELSRAKPHPMGERVCFALMGWSAEKGSRVYAHALGAGLESHGKYMSECQYREESQYVKSERGRKIQKKTWNDLMRRIERVSPEVTGFLH